MWSRQWYNEKQIWKWNNEIFFKIEKMLWSSLQWLKWLGCIYFNSTAYYRMHSQQNIKYIFIHLPCKLTATDEDAVGAVPEEAAWFCDHAKNAKCILGRIGGWESSLSWLRAARVVEWLELAWENVELKELGGCWLVVGAWFICWVGVEAVWTITLACPTSGSEGAAIDCCRCSW